MWPARIQIDPRNTGWGKEFYTELTDRYVQASAHVRTISSCLRLSLRPCLVEVLPQPRGHLVPSLQGKACMAAGGGINGNANQKRRHVDGGEGRTMAVTTAAMTRRAW